MHAYARAFIYMYIYLNTHAVEREGSKEMNVLPFNLY